MRSLYSNMSADPEPLPTCYMAVVVTEGQGMTALEFYKEALAAEEKNVYKNEDGTLMHAFLKSAYGFPFAIEEDTPKYSNVHPAPTEVIRGTSNYQYANVAQPHKVENADAIMKKAGAVITREPQDMFLFYGHRVACAVDKYGVSWAFSTRIPYDQSATMPKNTGIKLVHPAFYFHIHPPVATPFFGSVCQIPIEFSLFKVLFVIRRSFTE